MPSFIDKITVNKENDRRFKLTDLEREEIKELYLTTIPYYRKLARMFGVDHKTIKNIVKPEYYQEQLKLYKTNKHSQRYYNKNKHNKAIQSLRDYKRKLLIENKI